MNVNRHIMPGGYYFGRSDEVVATLLGSCVAVTLWHPRLRLMALTHFVLPHSLAASATDTRYGTAVFDRLQQDLQRAGASPQDCRLALFGGGACLARDDAETHIGLRNVAFAREQCQRLGWRVAREDLGDVGYRRISLDGRNGTLTCVHIASRALPSVAAL
jgi:chemotaxis protein CheD